MFSLELRCGSDEAETLSFQLWEAGTVAISQFDEGEVCILTAGFEDDASRASLLHRFAAYAPEWSEDLTDWLAVTRKAWPGRKIGKLFYVAPPWSGDPTPAGRHRLIQNPGQASGTGEHPCTQLALQALETAVFAGCKLLDVGTGSGILAIAGLKLGAAIAVGVDPDGCAFETASENFHLNKLPPVLAVGSADCITDAWADVTVANISATVLLATADDLLRVTAPHGVLILTGFPRSEAPALMEFLPDAELTCLEDWACLSAKLSSSASLPVP
ncbi:MAG: 50S ribosomal protein L11 methyltransferase [Bryobacteraceae bacterium]